jgi:hypothetical protein
VTALTAFSVTVPDDNLSRKGSVVIQDVSGFVPELVAADVEAAETEEWPLAAERRNSHRRLAVVG